jgi:hypothetical protein
MCVESALVVHVEGIATELREEPEQSAKNCHQGRTGRCRLWARTAASTCPRRSPTSPLAGTLTSIGLTRLPTSRPPPGRRPETGTVMTIGSTNSPLLSRI